MRRDWIGSGFPVVGAEEPVKVLHVTGSKHEHRRVLTREAEVASWSGGRERQGNVAVDPREQK